MKVFRNRRSLNNVRSSNVKFYDGQLSTKTELQRISNVNFDETEDKIGIQADIVGNNIGLTYSFCHNNIRYV